jgi:hypothetical protein
MGLVLDTNVFIYAERRQTPIDFSQWQDTAKRLLASEGQMIGAHDLQSVIYDK